MDGAKAAVIAVACVAGVGVAVSVAGEVFDVLLGAVAIAVAAAVVGAAIAAPLLIWLHRRHTVMYWQTGNVPAPARVSASVNRLGQSQRRALPPKMARQLPAARQAALPMAQMPAVLSGTVVGKLGRARQAIGR
jgi:hypothetical protein